jgi:ATP-dependent Clp protease ATP-binding subunit ClpB
MHKFDTVVEGALSVAQTKAMEQGNNELHPYHLLWGLINNPASYSSNSLKDVKQTVKSKLQDLPSVSGKQKLEDIRPHALLSEWLTHASSFVVQKSEEAINEASLLRFLPKILPELNIDYSKFSDLENEEETEVPKFLLNLNEQAQEGKLDPVIGRAKEIRAVMEILGRRGKNNPCLVGAAGVGKTAIAEGLAMSITKGKVPEVLMGKTVYSLDLGQLMAGTKFRGEFEERLQHLLKFVKEKQGEVILFIDEIHQLVGAGKTDGAMDAANLLKPALARGELHCIGATTDDEYQKYIMKDSALDRRFRPVKIVEPSKEDAIEILMGIREKMEIHHGIKISDDAIFQAVVLSTQYITDKYLPDKAIDLIDESSSALKLSAEAMPSKLAELEAEIKSKKIYSQVHPDNSKIEEEISALEAEFAQGKREWEKEMLTLKKSSELKNIKDQLKFDLEQAELSQNYEQASKIKYKDLPQIEQELEAIDLNWELQAANIAEIISRQTGIPVEKILKDEQENLLQLEDHLNSEIKGQSVPLKEISETILTSHAGLSDPTRPLGSFLLKGPSGVGKTETAKSLCRFLFNSERNLIRIDLSEYSEKHSVAKLIGAPAGYIGHEDGGQLTEAVRRNPYSLILFDEVEKAHKDFGDILLQILDDGRLTDNKGRVVNFKNCIIFLTTNSQNIEEDFRPEVLGRLDSILEYKVLNEEIMGELVNRELSQLNERLSEKQVHVELNSDVIQKLCERGYDPRYGARPLKSAFNKLITRPLAHDLILGTLNKNKVVGNWHNGLVVFE